MSKKIPRVPNRPYSLAMQELRRSNAATLHPSGKQYKRKPKHKGKGWA